MRRQYIDIENTDTLRLKTDTLQAPAAGEIAALQRWYKVVATPPLPSPEQTIRCSCHPTSIVAAVPRCQRHCLRFGTTYLPLERSNLKKRCWYMGVEVVLAQ